MLIRQRHNFRQGSDVAFHRVNAIDDDESSAGRDRVGSSSVSRERMSSCVNRSTSAPLSRTPSHSDAWMLLSTMSTSLRCASEEMLEMHAMYPATETWQASLPRNAASSSSNSTWYAREPLASREPHGLVPHRSIASFRGAPHFGMARQPEILVAGHHHQLPAVDDDVHAVGLLDHVVIRSVLEPQPRAGIGAAAFGHRLGAVGEQGNFEHGWALVHLTARAPCGVNRQTHRAGNPDRSDFFLGR